MIRQHIRPVSPVPSPEGNNGKKIPAPAAQLQTDNTYFSGTTTTSKVYQRFTPGIVQMEKGDMELYIPGDKELRGKAARDWINTNIGEHIWGKLKPFCAIMHREDQIIIKRITRFKLDLLLYDNNISKKVAVRSLDKDDAPEITTPDEPSDSEKLAKSNVETMSQINKLGSVNYHYNVREEEYDELGEDARTGYANPLYFTKLGDFTWKLRRGVSAAAAITDFINLSRKYRVIAECQSTAQAVNYYTILQVAGDKKFDAYFGGVENVVPEGQLLLLQKNLNQNPLTQFFKLINIYVEDGEKEEMNQDEYGNVESGLDSRPAQVGGWYFIENHKNYTDRHSTGFLMGENAFYYGRDKEGGQKFGGLGLENESEESILEVLAGSFNQSPSAKEIEDIYAKRNDVKYPGIQLPVLGDIYSMSNMPMNPTIMGHIQQRYNETFPEFPQAVVNANNVRMLARVIVQRQSKGKGLIQPVSVRQLSMPVRSRELDDNTREDTSHESTASAFKNVTWAFDEENREVVMDRTGVDKKYIKVSMSSAIKEYLKKYDLNIPGGFLSGVIRNLNDPLFNVSENIGVPCDKIKFPAPGDMIKLKKTPGGFQSLHYKILDPEKIKGLLGLEQLLVPNLEAQLRSQQVRLRATVTDGNCMYDAVGQQLLLVEGVNISISELRVRLAALIHANREYFSGFVTAGIDDLILNIITARSWDNEGGDIAAQIIPALLRRNVTIITPTGAQTYQPNPALTVPEHVRVASNGARIVIAYNGSNHYYSTDNVG